jgi:hypothetical protein
MSTGLPGQKQQQKAAVFDVCRPHGRRPLAFQARNYRRMYAESEDPTSSLARFYQEEEQVMRSQVASLQEQLIATPVRQNTTPRTPRSPPSF